MHHPRGSRDAGERRVAAILNTPPARILIGLVAGLAIGVWLTGTAHGEVAVRVAQPVGKLWLDALTMTVVPLVFALLVTGVMEAAREASGGKVAARAIGWFAILLIASTLLAAVTTTLVLRGVPLPPGAAALGEARGAGPVPLGDAHWLDNIIPTNPIRAAADTAMVPLVIFALLFGLGASGIEAEPRAALERVFRGIGQTMLRIVTWVL